LRGERAIAALGADIVQGVAANVVEWVRGHFASIVPMTGADLMQIVGVSAFATGFGNDMGHHGLHGSLSLTSHRTRISLESLAMA
jgi:hypothetical protein